MYQRFLDKPRQVGMGSQLLDIGQPLVMGILNVTPDSFYDGGRFNQDGMLGRRINEMLEQGADIIDVGGLSTRPGSEPVSENEERRRLEPALRHLHEGNFNIMVSVDTYRSEVARWAHENYGVGMINDISAGSLDPAMFQYVASVQLPYVMMHMQGNPTVMQNNPHYDNLMTEVIDFFSERLMLLAGMGFHEVIVDPGFGFGKDLSHNYQMLSHLNDLAILQRPLLIGISRKSMIYRLLGTSPDEALIGTAVLNTLGLIKGADILRVHDVREAKECIRLVQATYSS